MTKTFLRLNLLSLSALAVVLAFSAKTALADTLTITYYTIDAADPDANNLAGGTFTNEVKTDIGPDGLPVLNTSTYGCLSGCYAIAGAPTDIHGAGEITYWSPGFNSHVHQTSSGPITLPFSDTTLFAPNGTGSGDGGATGFQSLTLTGNITAPTDEQLSFSIKSDDMAFVYIDGKIVCSDGGIHAADSVTCLTPTVLAGTHTFALFFVDLNVTQSELDFSINTVGVTTTAATPEPSTFVMLGTGLLSAAGLVRRRFSLEHSSGKL